MKKLIGKSIFTFYRMVTIFFISLFVFLILFYLRSNIKTNVINILYWISIGIVFISFYSLHQTIKLKNAYGKGGHLFDWYDDRIKHKGVLWLKNIFDELVIDISKDKLVVVSPTANKGTYEKELFNHISNRGINTKVIATDLNLIENHEKNSENEFGKFIYLPEQNNAKDILDTLKKANEEKTDVILDFEGYLWYIKEFLWYKREKCIEQMIEGFKIYSNVLSDSGIIVVDNTKYDLMYRITRKILNFIGHFKFDIGENSTGQYLMYLYNHKKGKKFNQYIDNNFQVYPVDTLNEYGKTISVLCFKKKIKEIL